MFTLFVSTLQTIKLFFEISVDSIHRADSQQCLAHRSVGWSNLLVCLATFFFFFFFFSTPESERKPLSTLIYQAFVSRYVFSGLLVKVLQ